MSSITPKNGRVVFISAHDPHTYWELNSTNLGTNYGHDTASSDNTNVTSGDITLSDGYEGMHNQNDPPSSTAFDNKIVTDACALVYIPSGLPLNRHYGLWSNGGGTNGQGAGLRITSTGVEISCTHNNGNGSIDCLIEEIPNADLDGWFCIGWQFASNGGNQGDMGLWLNGSLVRSATRTFALDWGSGNPDFGNFGLNDPNASAVRDPSSYSGSDWNYNRVITGSGILIANFCCDNPTDAASGDSSPGAGNDFYTDYYNAHVETALTITSTVETITVTANDTTISTATNIISSIENITIHPINAEVAVGIIVSASIENIITHPVNVGIEVGSTLLASSESIIINPINAEVSLGTIVSASIENIIIHPINAEVKVVVEINAISEAVIVSPINAKIEVGSTITATTKNINVVSANPEVEVGKTIHAFVEDITITPIDADVLVSTDINATNEIITLTPIDADVLVSTDINATNEIIALLPIDADVLVSTDINATNEIIALLPIDADVGLGIIVTSTTEEIIIAPVSAEVVIEIDNKVTSYYRLLLMQ